MKILSALSFLRLSCAVAAMNAGALPAFADTLATIRETKTFRVGVDPGFFPFVMKKASGEFIGFDIEMASAFARELGAKLVVVETKWEDVIPALQENRFDVIASGMTITPERAKLVSFTDSYYRAGLTMLYGIKFEGLAKDPKDFNLARYTIALKAGTTGEEYAHRNFPKAKFMMVKTEGEGGAAVLSGAADAFVYDKPYVQLYSRKNAGKVAAFLNPLTVEDFGLGMRKNDGALVKQFNLFLKHWRAHGGYDEVYKRHFSEMPWIVEFPNLQ